MVGPPRGILRPSDAAHTIHSDDSGSPCHASPWWGTGGIGPAVDMRTFPMDISPFVTRYRTPSTLRRHSPLATFGAERRSGNFVDVSNLRTRTQSRAEFESSHARVPHTAGFELSPATVLRAATHQSNRRRFRAAYANVRTTSAYRVRNPAKIRRSPTADGHHERGVPRADEILRHTLTP